MMRSTDELGIELCDGMHRLGLAVTGRALPASELCDIFANLEAAGGHNLAAVLTTLMQETERSLKDEPTAEHDLRGRLVAALTRKAADHAQQIALCLEAAPCEIGAAQIARLDFWSFRGVGG